MNFSDLYLLFIMLQYKFYDTSIKFFILFFLLFHQSLGLGRLLFPLTLLLFYSFIIQWFKLLGCPGGIVSKPQAASHLG